MIDFLRYRYICAVFSITLIAVTGVAYYLNDGFRYSVDFTGGTQILLKLSKKVSSDDIKEVLKNNGYESVDLREFTNDEILVRVQKFESDAKGVGERVKSYLEKDIPDLSAQILQADSVGPNVGESLKWNSFKALIIAILCMLAYIAIRFKFAFSVGAIVALVHDTLAIIACFLLVNMEINPDVIAAILLILGYSVNDTIVIFARIRENIKKVKNKSMYDIVNLSINETLRRTILTSFATLLVVISLFILGGEALRGLSLALLIGIVFGTYSSIYIASPVMLLLYKQKN
ncbi:protein-export membrane protein SecF [candidate division TM6 bacterium RIFCSPHIGHO2_12_FULL_32_22]|nr:MAG: protein-export membrane protein SecF [candidate division TM6 bacterium RIFCSPHIGHO2_12_FULL_32_22]